MSENYLGIITENYDLVYTLHGISHGKVEIYRDTGVSINSLSSSKNLKIVISFWMQWTYFLLLYNDANAQLFVNEDREKIVS